MVAILLGATSLLTAGTAVGQEKWVHDPFICKAEAEGVYYLLCTGDNLPFRQSRDLNHWQSAGNTGTLFGRPPDWTHDILSRRPAAERSMPNLCGPTIFYFNNRYHLYCSTSLWGCNDMCIGLATNATLDPASPNYRWIDQGVVMKTKPGVDDFSAMTNIVVTDRQRNYWFLYGGWLSGIKLQKLDPSTGRLSATDRTVYTLAARRDPAQRFVLGPGIEGPFLYWKGGYWYLFVSFDLCCKGAESSYNIRVGRSTDIRGPYHDRGGQAMLAGGGTLVLKSYDNVRGPGSNQILMVEGREYHVGHWYDANQNGVPRLSVRPVVWSDDGWPLLGEMLSGPVQNVRKLRAKELQESLPGIWEHSVAFGKSDRLRFLPGGRMEGGNASWNLQGTKLTLRFPDRRAPGGTWVNHCTLSDDGGWYVCRYGVGDGVIIRGRKVTDDGSEPRSSDREAPEKRKKRLKPGM
jgi:arabinan endo-1,5-alpha-L-arabinosidase